MLQISVLALTALLLQGPSLDSPSPKERQAAIEQMAKPGNIEAIPAFESALKKESKSDVRAELLSGLVRIGGSAVPPIIARSLATDLDKDVRLQAVESLQRLYIPAPDTGTLKTLFNSAKNVVTGPQRPTLPCRAAYVEKWHGCSGHSDAEGQHRRGPRGLPREYLGI